MNKEIPTEIQAEKRYGYIRVSSKQQETNSSLDHQKNELMNRAQIAEENIFSETGSASSEDNRPVFRKLIASLKADDLLVVTNIDRCSRNAREFLNLQEELHNRDIKFISLDLPYGNDVHVNKLISTTFAAIATFENERHRERQRIGIEAAKKAGKYTGRKTVITPALIKQVKEYKQKNLSVTEIASLTKKSRNTIYKVLKNQLNYKSNRLVQNDED